MRHRSRKVTAVFLIAAFTWGGVPRPAGADDAVAKVRKVTLLSADPQDAKEASYPTTLVQLVTDRRQEDVQKDTRVQAGQAVLTRSANTHLVMDKGLEAVLYPDTFVKFDALNVWLLRQGRTYVVSKRGKLEIVVEALGRILVNSKVYLRRDGPRLLAVVTEGRVVLEANARTLSLGPGQAGRLVAGQPPQLTTLTPEEQADLGRDMEAAQRVMKGGGGGVATAFIVAAVLAGAAIVATRGGEDALPDLVPDTGSGCQFDGSGNAVLRVRNQGQADAPGSITRIGFLRGGALELDTPPVRAGESAAVSLSRNLLASLSLRVTVDAAARVTESSEDNNEAAITCPPDLR